MLIFVTVLLEIVTVLDLSESIDLFSANGLLRKVSNVGLSDFRTLITPDLKLIKL